MAIADAKYLCGLDSKINFNDVKFCTFGYKGHKFLLNQHQFQFSRSKLIFYSNEQPWHLFGHSLDNIWSNDCRLESSSKGLYMGMLN